MSRPDGSWLLDGHIPVPELKDRLNLHAVPEEERGRYHTLSGMVMLLLGRVPSELTWLSGKTGALKWWTWTARRSIRCWPPSWSLWSQQTRLRCRNLSLFRH